MSKKRQTKKKETSGSKGGGRAAKDDMPGGEMNRPVKSGMMEMPTGSETAAGKEHGDTPTPPVPAGGGLMPGEGPGATTAPQAGEMPGGSMSST
jgi:hypothetical protein